MFDADAFLKTLTGEPGVYQMLAADGTVLYVGKARHLKARVSSYFRRQLVGAKTISLMKQVAQVVVTVTNSEDEALLLENHLIKAHKPRYNILLRDDKSYPYLYLSTEHPFPRLEFYRGSRKLPGQLYGPYPSVAAVRETLNLLQRIFRIRSCKDSFFQSRTRPCLQYQIDRCTAPCVGYINEQDYAKNVKHVQWFLSGKSEQVIDELIISMEKASQAQAYELAAKYRDQIASLRKVQQQQVVSRQSGDIDVMALAYQQGSACVHVLTIRDGRVLGGRAYFPKVPIEASEPEILTAFIEQYYLGHHHSNQIPATIVTNIACEEQAWLLAFLSGQKGHRVRLVQRVRGDRAGWQAMAKNNADIALRSYLASRAGMHQRFDALQRTLGLEQLPVRLECFDISHTLGEATVGACVVFNHDGPVKSDYRRFNVSGITPGDDYAAMQQVLTRRYRKLKDRPETLPDIIFIDGGKGQVRVAEEVLESLQISNMLTVGVAKGPGRKPGLETLLVGGKALHLPQGALALHLIQQIRDEAHRFAITGHRKQRDAKRQTSSLEAIEGIGPKRRRVLLLHFGGLQQLHAASMEAIAKVPGISRPLAEKIYAALH